VNCFKPRTVQILPPQPSSQLSHFTKCPQPAGTLRSNAPITTADLRCRCGYEYGQVW